MKNKSERLVTLTPKPLGPDAKALAHDRRGRPRRTLLAILSIFAVLLGLLFPTAAVADAGSQPTLTIASLSPGSQTSGSAFNYRVTFGCSNVNADPCAEDPVIRIPLGAAAGMAVSVPQDPLMQGWEIDAGDLIIRLHDLTQGTSGSIDFRITPPNRVTPDGTQWTLTPTMTFSDDTPSVTAPAVTSTATASPTLTVQKKADFKYYRPGDQVTYSITWHCNISSGSVGNNGVEDLTGLVLKDVLPAGLTYVSSVPAGATVSGQTITMALSASQIGESCSMNAGTPVTVRITAKVDADVPDATVLGNTVTATGTSIGDATVIKEGKADVTVVAGLPGPGVSKSGYGPLVNNVGDNGSQDTNFGGQYRSATYPGAWLGRGVAATAQSSKVSLTVDSIKANSRIEAMYQITVTHQQPGSQFSLTDPMPCNSNASGASYSSYADGGPLCTDPAFHATLVTLDTQKATGDERVGIPANVVVKARLTDGSLIDLDAVFQEWKASNGLPLSRTYRVPDSAVGKVAEILIPRADGMTSNVTNIFIGGYVDSDRGAGDLIRNEGVVRAFFPDAPEAYAASTTGVGTIYVKEGPQVGIKKTYRPGSGDFKFETELFLSGQTTGDLTFTDTLPAGWTITAPTNVNVWKFGPASWASNIAATSATTVDPSTGRTVLTVTVPKDVVNSLLRPGGLGDRLRFEVYVPAAPPGPGTYSNTAYVNLSDPGNQEVCTQGDRVPGSAGSEFSCSSLTNITIQPPNGSAGVQVIKSVKGSNDSSFKTFPAIGYVEGDGGSVTFRLSWMNKGAASLKNVVAYDLLPRVGDTGTIPTTMNQQRGSTFQPTLTSISALPSGVTAYYSTAENPCRPEVLPDAQNPGCVDTWTAMPATPSDALLQDIRALKFVSSATYAFGKGFVVDVNMSTPPGIDKTDIAWNTFASAQINATNGQQVPVVESAKVGVAHKDFAHITIDKTVDKQTASVGDVLTYTVTAVNDGGSNLADITLRDTLPEGVAFLSASGGGVHSNGAVTWNLATMPLGRLFSFTVTVRISEGNEVPVGENGVTLVNRWGVDGTTPVTPLHPCTEPNKDNESCATTTISGTLAWSKIDDTAQASLLTGSEWTLQALDADGEPTGDVTAIKDCSKSPCTGPDKDPEGGKFSLPGLATGDYQLIETKAPAGFVLDEAPRTVTVLSTTKVTVLAGIVNTQQTALFLPLTGGLGAFGIWVGAGATGLLALAGLVWQRRLKTRG